MLLDANDGFALIKQAYKADTDAQLFAVWNQEHVFADPKHPVSFEDYKRAAYEKALQTVQPPLTAKEIIAKAERIKRADDRRR